MKKTVVYDIVFIIVLAIILVIINEFDTEKQLFKFRYVGFLIIYFIGRYVTKMKFKAES